MRIEYDPLKNIKNVRERGLSFDRVIDFDFETASVYVDDRKDYGERRYLAVGYMDGRLHILVYIRITGGLRVISFRKANVREARRYGKPKTSD